MTGVTKQYQNITDQGLHATTLQSRKHCDIVVAYSTTNAAVTQKTGKQMWPELADSINSICS